MNVAYSALAEQSRPRLYPSPPPPQLADQYATGLGEQVRPRMPTTSIAPREPTLYRSLDSRTALLGLWRLRIPARTARPAPAPPPLPSESGSTAAQINSTVRQLLGDGRGTEALRLVNLFASRLGGGAHVLRRLLTPPVVKLSGQHEPDRTQEYAWLSANERQFRGMWVAVYGTELVAAARSLKELKRLVADTGERLLFHRLPE